MLLWDALRRSECSICLQSLLVGGRSSASSTPNATPRESQVRAPDPSPDPHPSHTEALSEDGFQITYAPGVPQEYGASRDTFMDAYERSKNSRSGYAMCNGPDSQGTVVLPCGHFLHFLCAVQLYEYKTNATCPICRQPIKSTSDFVLFYPQQRPRHFTPKLNETTSKNTNEDTLNNNHPSSGQISHHCNHSNNEDGQASSSECGSAEVQVTGERYGTAEAVYSDHLQREAADLKRRRRTIRSREEHLQKSGKELEEQCLALEHSLGDARRRYEVLTQRGAVNAERLVELRTVAKETHASLGQLTAELAALTRDQAKLEQKLEKYDQKIQECRKGMERKRGHADTVEGTEALKKRRMSGSEGTGAHGISYYVSYEK